MTPKPIKLFFMRQNILLSLIFSMFLFGCSAKVNTPQSETAKQLEISYSKACATGECPCSSPLGPIVDGGSAIAYDTSEVECGDTCQPRAVKLVCKNGNFDRPIASLSFSCQVKACKACNAGNNQVPHGYTVQMYKSSQVTCGQSCDDNKRALVCKNGILQGSLSGATSDGKDSQYSFASCLPKACSCTIPDGGTMTLGGIITFYKSATGTCSVPCNDVSNTHKRTCLQTGTAQSPIYSFSGDPDYSKSLCLEKPANLCSCLLPDQNRTPLPHGQSQDLFTTNTLSNCNTCDTIKIRVYCDSGVLYDKPSTDSSRIVLAPGQLNSHRSLNCNPATSPDCRINNNCIANNSSQTLYGKATLTCADTPSDSTALFSCSSSNLLKNGLAYDSNSDIYRTTWQTSPPSNTCVGCALPWGGSVGSGSTVSLYKSSGISSNSCGTGCKQIQMRCQSSGDFTSGDPSIDADFRTNRSLYSQTCNNICNQEGGGAPPRFCLLPWQNSYVSADALIPMWKKKVVDYGDSCQNYFKLGRCLLSTGTFDVGLQYIYKSCTEKPFQGVRISSVTPKFVAASGGSITLNGTGFAAGMQVSIDKSNCTSINVIDSTRASCIAPTKTLGTYQISVVVGPKKAVLPNGLSYYSGSCTAGPGLAVFNYTGSDQTFTVPAGCNSVTVTAWGAGGGGRQYYTIQGLLTAQVGGSGGFSKGTFSVIPGSTLTVVVGSGGTGGYYRGSSGGGYSGIFTGSHVDTTKAVIIAGGGGGAGDPSGCNIGGTGGEGGGTKGGTHGSCSGLGGSQSAGGMGGASARPGTPLKGGAIGSTFTSYGGGGNESSYQSGGGGGGGYFGGGAGSEVLGLAGSGGGGSGFLAPAVTNGKSLTGSGRMPPNMTDVNYPYGIGIGGNDPSGGRGSANGGNGFLIISY